MAASEESKVDELIRRIVARAPSTETQSKIEEVLTTLKLTTQSKKEQKRSDEIVIGRDHHQIAFLPDRISPPRWKEGFLKLLSFIDRYEIADFQQIIELFHQIPPHIFRDFNQILSHRQIQILLTLQQNPQIKQHHLSQRIRISTQTLNRELKTLQEHFNLWITQGFDYKKFKFVHITTFFRTKSLKASEKLATFFNNDSPLFMINSNFSEDYRCGWFGYIIPDQPKSHKLFNERLRTLKETLISELIPIHVEGNFTYLSFQFYDREAGAWTIPSEYPELALHFAKEQHYSIPPPIGHYYGQTIPFDQLDYRIANLVLWYFGRDRVTKIQEHLRQMGFNVAKKTIWKRIQILKKQQVFYPIFYYSQPNWDFLIVFFIECEPRLKDILMRVPHLLPFSYIHPTKSGCIWALYMPSGHTTLVSKFIRCLHRTNGVHSVNIALTGWPGGTGADLEIANRWEENRQRWIIHEGDI